MKIIILCDQTDCIFNKYTTTMITKVEGECNHPGPNIKRFYDKTVVCHSKLDKIVTPDQIGAE